VLQAAVMVVAIFLEFLGARVRLAVVVVETIAQAEMVLHIIQVFRVLLAVIIVVVVVVELRRLVLLGQMETAVLATMFRRLLVQEAHFTKVLVVVAQIVVLVVQALVVMLFLLERVEVRRLTPLRAVAETALRQEATLLVRAVAELSISGSRFNDERTILRTN